MSLRRNIGHSGMIFRRPTILISPITSIKIWTWAILINLTKFLIVGLFILQLKKGVSLNMEAGNNCTFTDDFLNLYDEEPNDYIVEFESNTSKKWLSKEEKRYVKDFLQNLDGEAIWAEIANVLNCQFHKG